MKTIDEDNGHMCGVTSATEKGHNTGVRAWLQDLEMEGGHRGLHRLKRDLSTPKKEVSDSERMQNHLPFNCKVTTLQLKFLFVSCPLSRVQIEVFLKRCNNYCLVQSSVEQSGFPSPYAAALRLGDGVQRPQCRGFGQAVGPH